MKSRGVDPSTAVDALLARLLPVCAALMASFSPRVGSSPRRHSTCDLALDHYRALFETRDFWLPIRNSLVVAGSTTLMSVTIGGRCVRTPSSG